MHRYVVDKILVDEIQHIKVEGKGSVLFFVCSTFRPARGKESL
jgi:hypothetical protein